MVLRFGRLVALLLSFSAPSSLAAAQGSFTNFESGQVRPVALSPSGERLFVLNTPDAHLEVFDLTGTVPVRVASVPVGLEPVSVAARSDAEVWVVNHVSDSVSIVDVASSTPHVVRTLLVGDEPTDVVFAGAGNARAFVATAHRGQNSPYPQGEYDVEGIGRADVWVFDANDLGTSLGGQRLTILTLFGDKPRALAVTPDGETVYAAVFLSGNRTTSLNEGLVCNGGPAAGPCTIEGTMYPGGLPAPVANHEGATGPEVGLIVQFDGSAWRDELGRDWSAAVRFDLPDYDVFEIDATAATPTVVRPIAGVGTVLFGMAVHPTDGRVFVSNTEARNRVRFEGPGTMVIDGDIKPDGEPASVRGHLHEARITILDADEVLPRHLNKHIPYGPGPVPAGTSDNSLATPLGMAISGDGSTLYVAAFGSQAIGVFDTTELADDSFVPSAGARIALGGGGPTGLVLDEPRGRLYVLTRFDDALRVIDLETRQELSALPLHDPEPDAVRDGRRFLYDASLTSSNGEASCSSCHVFGDLDGLGWDLGNPDDDVRARTNPGGVVPPQESSFSPLKGPMTTQSLRGLANHGPMHWRGDRTGGGANALDETLAFESFNVAFEGLLGRDEGPLTDEEMAAFAAFALSITYPPNPARLLENELRPAEAAGRTAYGRLPGIDAGISCNACHMLDPAQGFFGGDGRTTFEQETQSFKVPHLRNLYQKVGMFGMANAPFFVVSDASHTGEQVRGFGYLHDGSTDTVARFLGADVFSFNPGELEDVEAYLIAFDTDLAPVVGQQVTLTAATASAVAERIDLLVARAGTAFTMAGRPGATECDLVVKGVVDGIARGFHRIGDGTFESDRADEAALDAVALRALVPARSPALTFTCAPPGSGMRMGVDRDEDGALDRDELDLGFDPEDPESHPEPPPPPPPPPGGAGEGCGCATSGASSPAGAWPALLALAWIARRRRRDRPRN